MSIEKDWIPLAEVKEFLLQEGILVESARDEDLPFNLMMGVYRKHPEFFNDDSVSWEGAVVLAVKIISDAFGKAIGLLLEAKKTSS